MLRNNGNCETCGVPINAAGTIENRMHHLFHQNINDLAVRIRGLEAWRTRTDTTPCHNFDDLQILGEHVHASCNVCGATGTNETVDER